MRLSDENRPQERIIRIMSPPHCARGPSRCPACKEASKVRRICLLRIFFDSGEIARPMIEIERDEKWSIHEYDVLRDFESEEDALRYAMENNLEDIDLS
ncbi:MAG: hypothetical protein ACFFED_09220 [Candidatus Thorarchaeota archaeon]